MAVLRITRFTTSPDDVPEMLAQRDALIAAVRPAYEGLEDTRIGRVDERTWIDLWTWRSRDHLAQAARGGPQLPEAAAASPSSPAPPSKSPISRPGAASGHQHRYKGRFSRVTFRNGRRG